MQLSKKDLGRFGNLLEFDISSCRKLTFETDLLENCEGLKIAVIDNCEQLEIRVGFLHFQKKLLVLSFSHNFVIPVVDGFIDNCPRLTKITMNTNTELRATKNFFKNCFQLRELRISRCMMLKLGDDFL
jgi:hypothetical protein